VESSVQFLHELGIAHEKQAAICTTTARNKRMKIVTLARFRYGLSNDLSKQERAELLQKARDFARSKPGMLLMSEKAIKEKFARAA